MDINEITLPGFKIIGIQTRTKNEFEADPAKAKIMPLWNKYFMENIEAQIPGRINENKFMGIYTDYESDFNGEYSLLICGETENLNDVPSLLIGKEIKEAKYLKFTNEGKMPGVVIETWKFIWNYFSENTGVRRAYTNDLELYDKTQNEKVEIFISIK